MSELDLAPIYSKITRRLVPFLMLLYMVALLDRVNISFAALTMNRDLGISEKQCRNGQPPWPASLLRLPACSR